MNDNYLVARDVCKTYKDESKKVRALDGISVELKKGRSTAIIGPSGAGKSTLLHILGGLDRPTSGHVLLDSVDIYRLPDKRRALIRNARIGFVFQFYHLLPELTVYENVFLPTLIAGKANKPWVKEVLKRVRLWNRRTHYPSELSGGEQQRVAIARSLVNHPAVVFCDEPTGNLDPETAGSVMALLNELNQQEGQAFLIVTHDEEMASRYERSYRLQNGVLFSGQSMVPRPETIINNKPVL